jgi:hypothetical protein
VQCGERRDIGRAADELSGEQTRMCNFLEYKGECAATERLDVWCWAE